MKEKLDVDKLIRENKMDVILKYMTENVFKDANKLEEIISLPELINIDIDDIVAVSNDEIVGSISQVMNSVDDEYIINSISNKAPNFCIFDISSELSYFISN